jgi:hypothetical protein
VPELTPESFKVATIKADSIVERARLSEALKIIDELEQEASTMRLAERFSKTRTLRQNQAGETSNIQERFLDMTEAEYRRWITLHELAQLKQTILNKVSELHNLVLDMEATKQD